jgi:hypothetical protein
MLEYAKEEAKEFGIFCAKHGYQYDENLNVWFRSEYRKKSIEVEFNVIWNHYKECDK